VCFKNIILAIHVTLVCIILTFTIGAFLETIKQLLASIKLCDFMVTNQKLQGHNKNEQHDNRQAGFQSIVAFHVSFYSF